jgi:uncharacterized protein (DUF486 family)
MAAAGRDAFHRCSIRGPVSRRFCSLRIVGFVLKSPAVADSRIEYAHCPALTALQTAGLLVFSNIFMTYAWYGHLNGGMRMKPWYVAAVASWGVALFEYLIQVPANRIGHSELSTPQLKIMQEVITLLVFVPFSVLYMKEPVRRDFLWAGLCLLGAVYFVFRGKVAGT